MGLFFNLLSRKVRTLGAGGSEQAAAPHGCTSASHLRGLLGLERVCSS